MAKQRQAPSGTGRNKSETPRTRARAKATKPPKPQAEPAETEAERISTQVKKAALLEALRQTLGVLTTACKIAKVSPDSYYRWQAEDPAFKQAVRDVRNVAIDFVETQMFKVIGGYTLPESKVFYNALADKTVVVPGKKHIGPDGPTIRWYLGCIAKERGYRQNADLGEGGVDNEPDTITLPNGQVIQL